MPKASKAAQRGAAAKNGAAAADSEPRTRRPDPNSRHALAMELLSLGGPPEPEGVGPVSDVERFPAMRMLMMKADEEHAPREIHKLIDKILEREQHNRFDYLAHADWTGKRRGPFEHLQGRSNNLTYHFMFALGGEPLQYTGGAEAFLAIYKTSEQNLDDIIALIPMPFTSVETCAILVRLVYMVEYVRRVIQTEESISLFEKAEYNEVVDRLFDEM